MNIATAQHWKERAEHLEDRIIRALQVLNRDRKLAAEILTEALKDERPRIKGL